MLCPQCGTDVGRQAGLCRDCERASGSFSAERAKPKVEEKSDSFGLTYANVFHRLVAFLIDTALLAICLQVVSFVIGEFGYGSLEDFLLRYLAPKSVIFFGGAQGFVSLLSFLTELLSIGFLVFLIGWLYFALMESSPFGATIGKMVVQIGVCDVSGNRPTFVQTALRHLFKGLGYVPLALIVLFVAGGISTSVLSVLIPVLVMGTIALLTFCYGLAGFTGKRQATHDILSDCLVVRTGAFVPIRTAIISFSAFGLLAFSSVVLRDEAGASQLAGSKLSQTNEVPQQKKESEIASVGIASVGKSTLRFKTMIAAWSKKRRVLEIGFFRDMLVEEERNEFRTYRSLVGADQNRPDMLLSLQFSKRATLCNLSTLRNIQIDFFKNLYGFHFPSLIDKYSFRTAIPDDPSWWDDKDDVSGLWCTLEAGERIVGNFKGSKMGDIKVNQTSFTWELSVDTEILPLR